MRSAVAIALLTLAPLGVAEAHIKLLQPMARVDGVNGDPQKDGPCGGMAAATRTTNRITTLAPGSTITVIWQEMILHTGWFRIAFQPNGDLFQQPPAGTFAPPQGGTNYPNDATGTTDAMGALILKDHIPDNNDVDDGMLQTDVTLPNMECDNCTLQFIQMMTGAPPYDEPDLYFNCADIVLAANAPDAGTQVTDPDAGVDPGSGGPNAGVESGGCSAAGGSGAALPSALALLGFVGLRRRRRA